MNKVWNKSGVEIDFNAAVALMDDDIREELHRQGYDEPQSFFAAYEQKHLDKYGEQWELSKLNPVW